MSAADITILDTLALLDAPLREFADGIADDRYAVWLGAGISFSKLPGLKGVAEAVLEHVRQRIDPSDPGCAFKACLTDIMGLVALGDDQLAKIDFAAPVASWEPIELVRRQLVDRYSAMLDLFPANELPDYLVWSGIGVATRYADPATTPGPEHLGLAALVMEGVASECASANWDDLIEKAMKVVDGVASAVLQVRVLPNDVQDSLRRARLYKFHGCAALAAQDEATYRPKIVGRQSQIDGWAGKPENAVIATKLRDLAISKGTLMLGLSAQDTNIQQIFIDARLLLPASFPTHPPAVMVSENAVGPRQRSLLQNFYRDDYAGQPAAIHAASLVQAYARSLLPALWLFTLRAKLAALIDQAAPALPAGERDALRQGLTRLRDLAAGAADPADHEAFMLQALTSAGRSLRLFHRGRAPTAAEGVYTPLTAEGVTRSLAAPLLATEGLVELSLALGLIGHGEQAGHWTCATPDPAATKSGAVSLAGTIRTAEVFFAASANASAQLIASGHVAEDDDAVIVHSFPVPAKSARNPTGAPGRTGRLGLREFSVLSVADNAVSLDVLLQQFKTEMAL